MPYSLTDNQKKLLVDLVTNVRSGKHPEEFYVHWQASGAIVHVPGEKNELLRAPEITRPRLDALESAELIRRSGRDDHTGSVAVSLTKRGYEAVDSNFTDPPSPETAKIEPTLAGYWKAADWQQKAGMGFSFLGVFFLGFWAAQFPFLKELLQWLKEIL